jgi:hypothetical protein
VLAGVAIIRGIRHGETAPSCKTAKLQFKARGLAGVRKRGKRHGSEIRDQVSEFRVQ